MAIKTRNFSQLQSGQYMFRNINLSQNKTPLNYLLPTISLLCIKFV